MIKEANYDTVFDAQEDFRKILDSMSRPGKLNKLQNQHINSPESINCASVLIGMSLMNDDVSFFADNGLQEYFQLNTSSLTSSPKDADFVFMKGSDNARIIGEMKAGQLETPESGATLVLDVDTIYDVPKDQTHEITLKGPGVKEDKSIYINGISSGHLEEIKNKNSEYPLGIDTIITDKQGNIVCIPRTNSFSFL